MTAAATDSKRRWVNWTCLKCDHPFRSRTRQGLFLTCPKCGEVQRGPAGVRKALDELSRLKRRHPLATSESPNRTVRL